VTDFREPLAAIPEIRRSRCQVQAWADPWRANAFWVPTMAARGGAKVAERMTDAAKGGSPFEI
jgi:hypothetical protein